MEQKSTVTRRAFIGTAAAATAFTILPRHVLGGTSRPAPSDRLNMALIGAGTMGMNMLRSDWLPNEDLHVACVCDPNTDSSDYRDWSPNGHRAGIRSLLADATWGANDVGIRSGREVGRQVVDRYYAKQRGSAYTGTRAYKDYRELLEAEQDLDGVLIMTPEHLHAAISIAAIRKGKHAITHKTLSNVLGEVRQAVAVARSNKNVVTHQMAWGDSPDFYRLQDLVRSGAVGTIREVHNWSNRPMWPQGWLDYRPEMPVPAGLDWDLWLGPVPHIPYNIDYTHALFRGWLDFGSGCLGDMGNYSLWRVYRILNLGAPTVIEASPCVGAEVNGNVSGRKQTRVAHPNASTIRFRHPATPDRPAVDVFWYDGGIRPITPQPLFDAGESLGAEGMIFVGDDGIIVGEFRGENPRVYPRSRQADIEKNLPPLKKREEVPDGTHEWINAVKEGRPSRGSFEELSPLAEATALGIVANRVIGRLDYEPATGAITNRTDANAFLNRTYRPGWELQA